MLACIACSKRLNSGVDDDSSDTPRSPALRDRDAVKNLSAQIKDVALKLSGSYRYSKPVATGQSELAGSKDDVLRNSNSSSSGTPKFLNALKQIEEEEEENKEWISHVEPGVIIALVSVKGGGNELKRIRFSREMFSKTQAQQWWAENHEKVFELYNVHLKEKRDCGDLPRSDDEEREGKIQESGGEDSPVPQAPENILSKALYASTSSYCSDADRSDHPQSSSDNQSLRSATNSSEPEQEQEEKEWVEEDEPGVYITIRSSPTGKREVKRVKLSCKKFSEMQARLWWEDNQRRIQEQYIDGGHDM